MVDDRSRRLLGSALRNILAAALLGVAAASVLRTMLGLGESYLARIAVLLTGGAALLLWRLTAFHPFARLGAANQVTMGRGVLVILLAGLGGLGAAPALQVWALWIGSVAAMLDAVDGWLARRTGMSSAYGARLDMETDALLILVLSLLAWQFGKAGAWVLGSGLMRYAFVAASLLLPWMQRSLPPKRRRKAVAVLQAIILLVALAPFVPRGASNLLCAMGLAMLAWSFLLDITWLRRNGSRSLAAH